MTLFRRKTPAVVLIACIIHTAQVVAFVCQYYKGVETLSGARSHLPRPFCMIDETTTALKAAPLYCASTKSQRTKKILSRIVRAPFRVIRSLLTIDDSLDYSQKSLPEPEVAMASLNNNNSLGIISNKTETIGLQKQVMESTARKVLITSPFEDVAVGETVTEVADPHPISTVVVQEKEMQAETCPTGVNFSGKWTLLVDDLFKKEYDQYLIGLGQAGLVRSIAVSIVGRTVEEVKQSEDGRELWLRGENVRGVWERTLLTHKQATIVTADGETVDVEAWWENDVHHSWLRGVTKYGGGDFESRRYMDGTSLVCESTFHPVKPSRQQARVTWKFAPTN